MDTELEKNGMFPTEFTHTTTTHMGTKTGTSQTAAARATRKKRAARKKQARNTCQDMPPNPELQLKPRPKPRKRLPPHLVQPATQATGHQQVLSDRDGDGCNDNQSNSDGGADGDDRGDRGDRDDRENGDDGDDEDDRSRSDYHDTHGGRVQNYDYGDYGRECSGGFNDGCDDALYSGSGGNYNVEQGHEYASSHSTVNLDEYSDPEMDDQQQGTQHKLLCYRGYSHVM